MQVREKSGQGQIGFIVPVNRSEIFQEKLHVRYIGGYVFTGNVFFVGKAETRRQLYPLSPQMGAESEIEVLPVGIPDGMVIAAQADEFFTVVYAGKIERIDGRGPVPNTGHRFHLKVFSIQRGNHLYREGFHAGTVQKGRGTQPVIVPDFFNEAPGCSRCGDTHVVPDYKNT